MSSSCIAEMNIDGVDSNARSEKENIRRQDEDLAVGKRRVGIGEIMTRRWVTWQLGLCRDALTAAMHGCTAGGASNDYWL
jgi:hypothetical protein